MLNIKNPRAHELASELSRLTGESLTDSVIHSLETEIERRKSQGRLLDRSQLLAFLEEVRRDAPEEFLSDEDPTAWLYDPETGLPA